MQFVKLAFVVTSCLAIRSAAAQPAAAQPAAAQPAVTPSQSVLPGVLSTSRGTSLDARIDYSRLDLGDDLGELDLFAVNLHLQYISPVGPGGYLSVPIAVATGDGDSTTELGNVELGGLYVFRNQNLDAYVRGGLSLKQTNTDDGFGILVPLANIVPRVADASTTGLGTSWGRVGAGLRLTSGALVVGASGGVNFPFSIDEDEGSSVDSLLQLSGSIGVVQPMFGLAAGVTMVQSLGDSSEDGDNNTFIMQVVGDMPVSRNARVYGGVGFNPEEGFDAYSIGVGVRTNM